MNDYSELNLEDAILMYAHFISDGNASPTRAYVHERICELIDVQKMEFHPFDTIDENYTFISEKVAERLIRADIKKLQTSTIKIPKNRRRKCPSCGRVAELTGAHIICECGYTKNLFDNILSD